MNTVTRMYKNPGKYVQDAQKMETQGWHAENAVPIPQSKSVWAFVFLPLYLLFPKRTAIMVTYRYVGP